MRLNKNGKSLSFLLFLVVTSFASDTLISMDYGSRYVVMPIYIMLEFSLLGLIYIFNKTNKWVKFILSIMILCFFVYSVYDSFFSANIDPNFSNQRIVSSYLFILISLCYFLDLYKNTSTSNLYQLPFFWINMAVLFYFGGNQLLFTAVSIFEMKNMYNLYIPIHSLLETLKNILFASAFIMQYYHSKKY